MPARKKTTRSAKAKSSATTKENQEKEERAQKYVADFEAQVAAYEQQLEQEVKAAHDTILQNGRMLLMELPKVGQLALAEVREMNWREFLFDGGDQYMEHLDEQDDNQKADVPEVTDEPGASKQIRKPVYADTAVAASSSNETTDADKRRTTRNRDDSVWSIPDSPHDDSLMKPPGKQQRLTKKHQPTTTGYKRTTTNKKQTNATGRFKTPAVASRKNELPIITPKVPMTGATPISQMRQPHLGEIMYSARGSPVTQQKGARQKRTDAAVLLQTGNQELIRIGTTPEPKTASDNGDRPGSSNEIEVPEENLGLIQRLQDRLARIVSYNRQKYAKEKK